MKTWRGKGSSTEGDKWREKAKEGKNKIRKRRGC